MNHPSPYDLAPPKASSIIESLRAFGYDLPTAIADLVDNSIAASAKNIWIHFHWNGADSTVSVTDDGNGMSLPQLMEAMRLGSRSPLDNRSSHDLGRFGLGLKTASLSQCRRLTVRTKETQESNNVRCWDLDVIADKDDWLLLRQADIGAASALSSIDDFPHGTVVVWQKLDRLTRGQDVNNDRHHRRFLTRTIEVGRHLSMVFHRFMVGRGALRIHVNGQRLDPWDPFVESNHATHRLPTDTLRLNGSTVTVQPFILPHSSKLTKAEFDAGAGIHGWLAHQGFYVYRNDRLLVTGDWLGLGWTKDEHMKLARIAVNLPNTLDQEWQIDVTKSKAIPPATIREELRRIGETSRREAKKIYTHRGARLTPEGNPGRVLLWLPMARHDKRFYSINREHPLVRQALTDSSNRSSLTALLRLLEETVPFQHISVNSTEKPDCYVNPYEDVDASEVISTVKQSLQVLIDSGHSQEEAKAVLMSLSPFDQIPAHLIAAAIDQQ